MAWTLASTFMGMMTATGHSSMFSYNISRNYPYRWFTPVTLAGGVIAFVLVSFLSIATQGYETIAVYSSSPNTTSNPTVFTHWPSYLTSNTDASCSSNNLPIGSTFYTNNTALLYTIASVNQVDRSNPKNLLAGSLPYQNNPFQNCTIDHVQADFSGIERTASQIAVQQWGVALTAYCDCMVETPYGELQLSLTTTYDLNPSDTSSQTWPATFPGRNETSKTSLWWGESLMAWYYAASTRDIESANQENARASNISLYKGSATFSRSSLNIPQADDIKSLDFFNAGCYFISFNDTGVEENVYFCHADGMGNKDKISRLIAAQPGDGGHPLPGIWLSTDSLAKLFYFTIMADLGQTAGDNILTDPDLLEFFSSNITDFKNLKASNEPWGTHINGSNIKGIAKAPFTKNDPTASSLKIKTPSVIAANYLCQEPRLKSRGTLVVSVIVNSLAILNTIWAAYKFLIDYLLMRKHPELNVCAGTEAATKYGNGSDTIAFHQTSQDEEIDSSGHKMQPDDTELRALRSLESR